MQSVSQATEIVSYVTGTPRGRASQIARALIDAGILPKSSGRDIKKISAKEMLPLLAAVAMADKVADAAKIAAEFADLPLNGGHSAPVVPDKAEISEERRKIVDRRLAEIFTPPGLNLSQFFHCWMKPAAAFLLGKASLEFAHVATGHIAKIAGELLIVEAGLSMQIELPFWRDRSWGHFYKRSFTLAPEGVDVMRNLFARDDIEGMHFSLSTARPQI